jgi:D-arabinose 1-dehydrogenase-like Zn-dependent alcohol dehydrogenase
MKKVWLIGAGGMAQDYMKVLKDLNATTTIIGRGEKSSKKFKEITGKTVEIGGLNKFLNNKPTTCSHAIITVGVEGLFETTKQLLNYNIKNILVEKQVRY